MNFFDNQYLKRYHVFMMIGTTLDEYLKKQLKNPKFKKEWDKLEVQCEITRELIRARIEGSVSQRELARRAKTTQAVISRIENMTVSPSVGLLERIANALDKKLEVKFT
jgi:ribosome-binding protein aMBF1 (putative translation factor)